MAALTAAGYQFEWQRLGSDEFNEAALRTPDGQLVHMLEARTYSSGEPPVPTPLTGHCSELTQNCANSEDSRRWFEAAGFLPIDAGVASGSMQLRAPGLTIGLRPEGRTPVARLRFVVSDPPLVAEALEERDLAVRRTVEGYELRAPEGTRLVIET